MADSDYTTIALSVDDGGLARRELRRADAANAMNLAMARDLRHAAVELLHDPSVALKEAAGSTRGDRLIAALRELFALDDDDASSAS